MGWMDVRIAELLSLSLSAFPHALLDDVSLNTKGEDNSQIFRQKASQVAVCKPLIV
jgi:hypothetical protein